MLIQRTLFLTIGAAAGALLTGALRNDPEPGVIHEPAALQVPSTPPAHCLAANVEIAKLQAALDAERTHVTATTAPATTTTAAARARVPFPVVPERFKPERLSQSLNSALAELHRPGEVKAIDCS